MKRLQNRSFTALTFLIILLYWTVLLQRFGDLQTGNGESTDGSVTFENQLGAANRIPEEVEEEVDHDERTTDVGEPEKVEVANASGDEEKWAGETIEIHDEETPINKQTFLAELPPTQNSKYFPAGATRNAKYFMYQPSGGWGNQRFILRWAMIVANAMNRTLVVAPLAPHSDIWHGYNQWRKDQVIPADKVLDVRALHEAVDRGVVFIDDVPLRIAQYIQNFTKLSLAVHVKGHYVNRERKKLLVYRESEITEAWRSSTEDVIFWDKMSMWQCCVPNFAPDMVWYGRHIMFNSYFKSLARTLMEPFGEYNAVHVRRGDMTISKDRRSAEVYYKAHRLESFDKGLPLYIATNEREKSWFDDLTLPGRFTQLVFYDNLDSFLIDKTIKMFPTSMKGDVIGFIEVLICGNAVKWEGSRKSTFSAAISTIRMASQLRTLKWEFPKKPSIRKGITSDTSTSSGSEIENDELVEDF